MSGTQIDYKGKKVVVVGASSGVGEDLTRMLVELGAETYALDLNPTKVQGIKEYIRVDLGSKESVEAAAAALPDGIDAYFQTAAIAGTSYMGRTFTPLQVVTINFIGTRHLIESLIPKMNENSAIVTTTSLAARRWREKIEDFKEFVHLMDWQAAQDYIMARIDDPVFTGDPNNVNRAYNFTKECLCIYTAFRAWDLSFKKIRINTVSPAGISTPMHDDFNMVAGLPRGSKLPTSGIGEEATGEQIASVLLAVNSNLCDYVSGADIPADYAMSAAMNTGSMQSAVK